jgi:uncharacterized protein
VVESTLEVAGFDWDQAKRPKCQKLGVPLADIEAMFQRPVAVVPDPFHSIHEERFKAIGKSAAGRSIFVVFTLRTRNRKNFIRPISARYMHRKGVEHYEKEEAAGTQKR